MNINSCKQFILVQSKISYNHHDLFHLLLYRIVTGRRIIHRFCVFMFFDRGPVALCMTLLEHLCGGIN